MAPAAQPKPCAECGTRRAGRRIRGLCMTCYQRLYKRDGQMKMEDDLPALRETGRRNFFRALREGILGVLAQTETNDSPAAWCEEHVRLPPSKSALRNGRVSWEITPDSVEIMEQLRTPTTRKIVTMYSSQGGKSLLLQCAVCYLSQVRGDSIIYGLPSLELQKKVPLTRFEPMLELSKIQVAKRSSNFVFSSQQTLSFVLMSSRAQLQEATARVIMVDELTELGDLDFDPLTELEQRTTLFQDALMWIASTPKQRGEDIHAEYMASRRNVIEWSCKACGGWFTCEIEDIKSESTSAELILTKHLAYVACPHCGVRHTDSDHRALVMGQRWRCIDPERPVGALGYRKCRWQTVFRNFSQTLSKYLEVRGDPVAEQAFAANWCADPLDTKVTDVGSQNLVVRRGAYQRRSWPEDAIGWALGADVQGDELYVSVVAVSPRGLHVIDNQRIQRDSDQDKVVRALRHVIADRPWSGKLPYLGGAIDSGYSQENVLAWCAAIPQCIPVKGDPRMLGTVPYRHSSDGRLLNVNPNYTNDLLQGWVVAGVLELASDEWDVVERHIKNEVKRTYFEDGQARSKWELISERSGNHYRDAIRYACMLLHYLGFAKFSVVSAYAAETPPQAEAQPPAPPKPQIPRAPMRGIMRGRDRY